jgi:hypothetical protein
VLVAHGLDHLHRNDAVVYTGACSTGGGARRSAAKCSALGVRASCAHRLHQSKGRRRAEQGEQAWRECVNCA